MTIHFASFLLDIILWIIFGVGVGSVVHRLEDTRSDRVKEQLRYIAIAIATGLFAVLDKGLPDQGVAGETFIFVAIITTAIAYCRSGAIRKYTRSKLTSSQVSHSRSRLLKTARFLS